MGRPPKNKTAEIQQNVPFVPSYKNVDDTEESESIKCQLVLIPEHKDIGDQSVKKHGRYSTSFYRDVSDYGKKNWIVLSYVYTDFEKYRKEGLSDEVIMKRCVNFLNSQKDNKGRNKFGELKLFRYNIINKNGYVVSSTELIVNNKKISCYWGEGYREG